MEFDKVKELATLLENSSLTKLRLEEDGTVLATVAPAPSAPTAPAPAAAAPSSDDSDDAPYDMSKLTLVKAPMVGVFYAAPSPGADPFVHVGSKVKKGDTLCVMEAMKLMNEVVAEVDGEVVDVCVEDGDLVEFGGTLMKIY